MKNLKRANRLFAVITSLALLVQPILPVFPTLLTPVYAQEVTPTSEPTTNPDPTPTEEISPTPTEEVSPTPTEEITPTVTPETTPSATPTEEVTPTPSEQTNPPQQQNGEPPHETSPPQEQGEILDGASTEATPTITPEQPEEGELQAVVLQNVEADSLNLDNVDPNNSAALTTDKADYAPTDTAVITGTGFKPNHDYKITVSSTDEPATSTTVQITTDENGTFVYAYQLDGTYRPNYQVAVTNQGGHVIATTTFTDSAAVNEYSQCSNDTGTGYTSGNTGCRWINGNLQSNNSAYYEGDATPQRLYLTGLVNGTHTVVIKYGTTKGGKHAYDYVTDDVFSENWITNADFCEGLTGFSDCSTLTPNLSSLIPTDTNAGGFDVAQANRHFKIRNGSFVSVGTPTLVSGSYAGDSETTMLLTFNVDTNTCVNKVVDNGGNPDPDECPVLITWGEHVSRQSDWGTGNSAVNISGSPYHVSLETVDGASAGSRDNQMQAGAIKGSITIIKDSQPNSDQDFSFTTSGTGLSSFSLDDDTDPTLSNTIFFGNLDTGTYTVSEGAAAGWSLSNITCTDPTQNSTSGLPAAPTAIINLAAGENVTCTFTNTQVTGSITVVKDANPNDPQDFSFTTTGTGLTNFSLDDDADGTLPAFRDFLGLTAGTYTITEGATTGWTLDSAICLDNTTQATVATGNGATITLAAGQNVTCRFTNTKQAKLTVIKDLVTPNDPGLFNLLIDGTPHATNVGNFGSTGAVTVSVGQHTISETAGTSTSLDNYMASYSCVGEGAILNGVVTIAAGDNKTCYISNTRKQSLVTVNKQVDDNGDGDYNDTDEEVNGAASGAFTWTLNGGTPNTMGSSVSFPFTQGATVSVTENTVPGYTFVGWYDPNAQGGYSCSTPYSTSPLPVTYTENGPLGSNKTFTLCNRRDTGNIVGTKFNDRNGDGGQGLGEELLAGWTFDLKDQAGAIVQTVVSTVNGFTFTNVPTGNYLVCERPQDGWTQTAPVNNGCWGVTLSTGGQLPTSADFGNRGNLQITACKYEDLNGLAGGTQGPGVPNWGMTLGQTTQPTGEGGCTTFEHLTPGMYQVSELPIPDGWYSADDSNGTRTIVLTNQNVTTNFFNYRKATITVVKNVLNPQGGEVEDTHEFTVELNGEDSSQQPIAEPSTQANYTVNPGTYTISELNDGEYSELGCTLVTGAPATGFTVNSHDQITVTCTNQQIPANITVIKRVVGTDGETDVTDTSTDFAFHFEDNNPLLTDDESFSDDVDPGEYFVNEDPDDNYDFLGCEAVYDNQSVGQPIGNGILVSLGSSDSVTVTCTNGQKTGSINGSKWNDLDGDGGRGDESGLEGWTIFLDENEDGELNGEEVFTTTDPDGYYEFTDLNPDTYRVCEVVEDGWVQTYPGAPSEPDCHYIVIGSNDTQSGYDFGNLGRGSITVIKDVIPDDESQWFFDILGANEFLDQFVLVDEGDEFYPDLDAGSYSISEEPSGFYNTSYDCGNKGSGEGTSVQFNLNAGDEVTCTFTNRLKTGDVIVTKYNDENGDGNWDEDEETLPGWNMHLIEVEGATTIQATEENGTTTFDDMPIGSYILTETVKDGWEQTELRCDDDTADDTSEGDGNITLTDGEIVRCYVGNHQLNPILTISKFHAPSDDNKNPGDSVMFTIVVKATQSAAFNVEVSDLPAGGFTYRAGSWTSSSTERGDLKLLGTTTEPTYASPGVWQLGDMPKDDIVTLTYIADISSNQKPGLYKDLAWAFGCRFETNCASGDANSVLSNAVNPGFVDDNFVGTQVNIVKDQQSGATLNPTTGEVLGAMTELPATGADELWLKLAALFFLVGLGLVAAGRFARRIYV